MGTDKKILIALVIILVAVQAYKSGVFTGAGVEEPVRKGRVVSDVATGGGDGAALRLSAGIPELMLERLGRARPPYTGIEKNIFDPLRFSSPRPPAPASAPTPVVEVAPPPEPEPLSPLTVFIRAVKFMGFMEKALTRTVFLARGEDVYLVKKGDMIDGRFLVTVIKDTEMRLRDPERGEDAFIAFPGE